MSALGPDSHPAKRPRVGERTMLACINCKQRKLKCDGQTPKCRNCTRTDRECLVEDPATGLHRPRDYIRSLEARVAYLEGLLQNSRPEVALDHLDAISPHAANIQHGDRSPGNGVPSVDGGAPDGDMLSNEVALLCLGAAGREPQYFGPSSAVHFSRVVSSAIGLSRKGEMHGSERGSVSEVWDRGRPAMSVDFPSLSKMAKLSEAYFQNIHPQYPFLHRPTFRLMEKECLDASIQGDLSKASDASMYFVLMVCATGCLTLGPSATDEAESYFSMALEHIAPLLDLDNIQSVQTLLCCAIYSIRSPTGASLWKISGMAVRHCIELGYHRSTDKYRSNADVLTKEMSKRCFWVAYDIDRVASFILGRPVGIPDNVIDVELPMDIDDESLTPNGLLDEPRSNPGEPPTSMTGALHAIKLRQLWSKFNDTLYSRGAQPGGSIESLRQELEEWRASVPEKLESSQTRAFSVFASNDWFQLAYDYSVLLLYRPYIVGTYSDTGRSPRSPAYKVHADAQQRAFEICSDRARDMCLHYRRLYQSQASNIQFTWGSLHILFLGGLTYLYCLWRSPRLRQQARATTIMNTCMACTTVLTIIAERWGQASSYRDIFEVLSERTIDLVYKNTDNTNELDNNFSQPTAHRDDPISGNAAAFSVDNPDFQFSLQDWIMGMDDSTAPGDPQWLAQELFQGIQDHS